MHTTTALPLKHRVASVDILRGIVMIIMALDHTREYFHIAGVTGDPTNLATTTPLLFFTRWITHFCAPIFVLLSGTSAFLAGQKRTKKALSRFLLTRGLWLVLVEIIVFNFLFSFDPAYSFIGLQVIWVIGVSMIILAVLIYLPISVIFFTGLIMVIAHNLLDLHNYRNMQDMPLWWGLLHQQNFVSLGNGRTLGILYPLLPWPGVMMLGYCLGTLYTQAYDAEKRKKLLMRCGLIIIAAFFVLRWLNIYGDASLWTTQKDAPTTILSFFNVTKYPPSLLYLCMTLGPALCLLTLLEGAKGGWRNIVAVYGKVPFFYYLLHFFIIHLACTVMFFINGHTLAEAGGSFMLFRPADFGYPLGMVYVIWLAIVLLLYPLCRRYSKYKSTHTHWWLSYL